MVKTPQQMTEEEYVTAYSTLPGLNKAYVRARYLFMHRRCTYDDVLRAYKTTPAHGAEKIVIATKQTKKRV